MPTLAVYLHRLDPFLIEFPQSSYLPAGIRWYGLSYLLGFVIAYFVIRRVTRLGVSTVKPENVGDLIVNLAIGVVIGGRLGYCAFYKPDLLVDFNGTLPFWGVLRINEGGMASHGGMIGGIVASWYYAWRHKHSWPFILDLFAFGAPLGLFFGRIANFINGELYGRECPLTLPWGVKFPQEMHNWSTTRLTELRAALDNLPGWGLRSFSSPEQLIAEVNRAIQNGDAGLIRAVEPMLTPRHPSQLYEALLEGLVLFAVLAFLWCKPRKPLVIGGTFCLVYGLVRILGEFFRMPDDHIARQEFLRWGVTRGQWLSVLLALAGAVLIVIFTRRNVEPMGSWRGTNHPKPPS